MAAKVPKTRSAVKCPVFGEPKPLKPDHCVLPTYEDIMKYYLWIQIELKSSNWNRDPTVAEISPVIVETLKEIWQRASIPVVSYNRIMKMLMDYHDKCRNLKKCTKSKKGNTVLEIKLKKFRESAKGIFDISACKCKDFALCHCIRTIRVPEEEREFLRDQRNERRMVMSGIDKERTRKKERIAQRIETETLRKQKSLVKSCEEEKMSEDISCDENDDKSVYFQQYKSSSEYDSDSNNQPSTSAENGLRKTRTKRYHLPSLALACERTGVSDRAAAIIASATLEDMGLISNKNKEKVIDRMTLRRQRQKKRNKLREGERRQSLSLEGLYFDGRKDQTMSHQKKGMKIYRKIIKEEHVLVQEPGSKYIGHISPKSSSADCTASAILEYLRSNNIATLNLKATGSDGTTVNIERKGGIIRILESRLRKPLQWLICLLHANEFPLRHLFQQLDGTTTGPRGFVGPIGKQLEHCEEMEVVRYERIETQLPKVDCKDLSTDQKCLYEISQAVSSGVFPAELAKRNPGKMAHSRWLTTANRILRFYVSCENPCNNLKVVANYVAKVYAPMWFIIKMKPSCKDGSKHLWQLITYSRYLEEEHLRIIDPVIQRNSFFGHHENILLAMLTDPRRHIRELGLRRIMKARSKPQTKNVRQFEVRTINFEAVDYVELIDWSSYQVTKPPVLSNLTNEELNNMVETGETPVIDFPRFPCHSQSVERCVKIDTEATAALSGAEARDGFILAKLVSRNIMPVFNTKKDYKTTK